MRVLLLLVCLLPSLSVLAQRAYFDGRAVDTFEVYSTTGHYHFNDSFGYVCSSDKFVIYFESADETYRYLYFKTFDTLKDNIEKSGRRLINTGIYKKYLHINKLSETFKTQYSPITVSSSGVTKSRLRHYVKGKRVREIVNRHNCNSHGKELRRDIKRYKDFEYFENYLEDIHPDTTRYEFSIDYTDKMRIQIVGDGTTYCFFKNFPDKFRYPWLYDLAPSSTTSRKIYNLDFDCIIVKMLPHNFKGRNAIGIDGLLNSYLNHEIRGMAYDLL